MEADRAEARLLNAIVDSFYSDELTEGGGDGGERGSQSNRLAFFKGSVLGRSCAWIIGLMPGNFDAELPSAGRVAA